MKQKLVIVASILSLMLGLTSEGISQWVQTNGPYGGDVSHLAAIGTNLFAVTSSAYGGRLFLSTDNGGNWMPVNTPWGQTGTGTLMVSGNTLFVVASGGIFLTTDLGVTWTKTAGTGLTSQGSSPTCFAVIGTTLFAGIGSYSFRQNEGLYRSTDNGGTWIGSGKGLSNSHVHALASSGTNLFAGTTAGVCLSTDNGANWKLVDSGLSNTVIYSLALSGNNMFAATSKRGILRSTDNGVSWKVVNISPKDTVANNFAVSGGDFFAGTVHGVFRTTDNGESWFSMDSLMNYPAHAFNQSVTDFAVSGSNIFAATHSGVYLSTNRGSSWKDVTSQMIGRGVSGLLTSGSFLYGNVTEGKGLYSSTDDGEKWQPDSSGLHFPSAMKESGTNLIASSFGGIYISVDKGLSWTKSADSGLLAETVRNLSSTFAMIESDLFISSLSSTNGGVFRSTDMGASWTAINNGFTYSQGISDSNQIFAIVSIGTELFAASRHGGIYHSSDYGAHWIRANLVSYENDYFNGLSVIGTNLYVGVSGVHDSIYVSSDNGSVWKVINSGVPGGIDVSSFTPSGTNIFAIGSSGRVFISTNSGISWVDVYNGLGKNVINSIAIKGSNIFAGTMVNGVWRRPLSDFGISEVKSSAQSDLNISISPNPSTGIITIHNAPANTSNVSLLNVLGEKVLDIDRPNAGEFTFDFSKLPPGTYFARFMVGDEVITRKILKE